MPINHFQLCKVLGKYTDEERSEAIKAFKEKNKNKNSTATDDEIVTDKIQDDIMNTRYGDGYLSMSLLYGAEL